MHFKKTKTDAVDMRSRVLVIKKIASKRLIFIIFFKSKYEIFVKLFKAKLKKTFDLTLIKTNKFKEK